VSVQTNHTDTHTLKRSFKMHSSRGTVCYAFIILMCSQNMHMTTE